MKYLLGMVLIFLHLENARAQSIEKTYIKDPVIQKVLSDFLVKCYKQNTLYNDKGVVMMTMLPDTDDSLKMIQVYQSLDDGFRDTTQPNYYAHFMEKVILTYDRDKPIPNWNDADKRFLL